MFQALKWFRVTFGLPFTVDHWLTQPFRLLPPDHRVQQRTELQRLGARESFVDDEEAVRHPLVDFDIFFVWAAISCVRFEHFQRSRYMESHPQCLIFECSQGKARRRGARAPYSWATYPNLNFLWPALHLSSEDVWEVTEGTAWLVNRKMSRGRFLELLRGTLLSMRGP